MPIRTSAANLAVITNDLCDHLEHGSLAGEPHAIELREFLVDGLVSIGWPIRNVMIMNSLWRSWARHVSGSGKDVSSFKFISDGLKMLRADALLVSTARGPLKPGQSKFWNFLKDHHIESFELLSLAHMPSEETTSASSSSSSSSSQQGPSIAWMTWTGDRIPTSESEMKLESILRCFSTGYFPTDRPVLGKMAHAAMVAAALTADFEVAVSCLFSCQVQTPSPNPLPTPHKLFKPCPKPLSKAPWLESIYHDGPIWAIAYIMDCQVRGVTRSWCLLECARDAPNG